MLTISLVMPAQPATTGEILEQARNILPPSIGSYIRKLDSTMNCFRKSWGSSTQHPIPLTLFLKPFSKYYFDNNASWF